MKTINLKIELGFMAPPLRKQLRGFRIPSAVLAKYQAMDEAVSRLYIGGVLTDSEKDRVRSRLCKKLIAEIPRRPTTPKEGEKQ